MNQYELEVLETDLADDFMPFYWAMMKELVRHYPKKGDSWKTCDLYFLIGILQKHLSDGLKPMTTQQKKDHVVDIANLCAMVWLRLSADNGGERTT